MSLIPLLLGDMYDDFARPSRLLDQHFGVGLFPEDLLEPLAIPPRNLLRGQNYYRPWRSAMAKQDVGSTVSADKNRFQISLDVQQFSPEEITVKTVDDNCVVVEGKHEEKKDQHGYISRHFVRRYILPKDHDIKNVTSTLSSDGVLTIIAPKKQAIENANERIIPISHTGPAKAVGSGDHQNADNAEK